MQTSRFNSYPSPGCCVRTWLCLQPRQKLCAGFLGVLFIAMCFSIGSLALGSESTNSGEFLSEVIPIQYAKAYEIASALYIFRTNGVGRTASLERMDKRLRSAGRKLKSPQVKFIADERNNSILVYAGREDMTLVKEIVSTLDTAAAQILIEAVIVEINCGDKSRLTAIDDEKISWMTNFVSDPAMNAPSGTVPTDKAAVAGFYRSGSISNDLDSFVAMLATNTSARILQRPRIQTFDEEPAQMFIGESRPYPSGSYTCGSEYSSIQAINQGVTLEVTPSIATNGLVALDIHQTIEEANGSVTIANVGDVPITRRTERNAKAIVSDRSMLVLDGSLEQNNATRRPGTFKRILTLNGSFHRSKSVTNQNELIVLLRPTILPTPEVAQLSKAEKDRIPALKHTELEIQSEETNRLKQLDKKLKNDRDLERN